MTLWCKLLALAAGLPGLAAAADPEMMNLVMPDASVVMEVNIAKIMASPIGSAMGEAVHQGIAKQLKVELTKAKPQFQEQIAGLSNIDWSREVRDIVIAGGPGKPAQMLTIVRTSLDPARIQALAEFRSDRRAQQHRLEPGGAGYRDRRRSRQTSADADDRTNLARPGPDSSFGGIHRGCDRIRRPAHIGLFQARQRGHRVPGQFHRGNRTNDRRKARYSPPQPTYGIAGGPGGAGGPVPPV